MEALSCFEQSTLKSLIMSCAFLFQRVERVTPRAHYADRHGAASVPAQGWVCLRDLSDIHLCSELLPQVPAVALPRSGRGPKMLQERLEEENQAGDLCRPQRAAPNQSESLLRVQRSHRYPSEHPGDAQHCSVPDLWGGQTGVGLHATFLRLPALPREPGEELRQPGALRVEGEGLCGNRQSQECVLREVCQAAGDFRPLEEPHGCELRVHQRHVSQLVQRHVLLPGVPACRAQAARKSRVCYLLWGGRMRVLGQQQREQLHDYLVIHEKEPPEFVRPPPHKLLRLWNSLWTVRQPHLLTRDLPWLAELCWLREHWPVLLKRNHVCTDVFFWGFFFWQAVLL